MPLIDEIYDGNRGMAGEYSQSDNNRTAIMIADGAISTGVPVTAEASGKAKATAGATTNNAFGVVMKEGGDMATSLSTSGDNVTDYKDGDEVVVLYSGTFYVQTDAVTIGTPMAYNSTSKKWEAGTVTGASVKFYAEKATKGGVTSIRVSDTIVKA